MAVFTVSVMLNIFSTYLYLLITFIPFPPSTTPTINLIIFTTNLISFSMGVCFVFEDN